MLPLHPSSLEFSRLPIPEEGSASIHPDSGSEVEGFSLFCSDSVILCQEREHEQLRHSV